MINPDYLSEVIYLEYLQSLQSNNGKSIEVLQKEDDTMITFSDLNVWFFNKDSDMCLDDVKNIFDSLSQNKLGKASLRDFMRAYTQKLMNSVQNILNQQSKVQSYQNVITNAQCISQFLMNNQCTSFENSEILSTCADYTTDTNILKEINNINNPNIIQTELRQKSSKNIRSKVNLQIKLKEIINIDLVPSFSKLNLEGYQIEIGEEKKYFNSSIIPLEGASINWREELINLTIRPKCQSIFIRLYEVLTQGRNLVAQIVIDPFTLICPFSFSKPNNLMQKLSSNQSEFVHCIPLQCTSSQQIYCNLILSAQIYPIEPCEFGQNEISEFIINESYNSTQQIIRILNQRIEYITEKLRYGIEKYQKMIKDIQLFVKPFQSIKLDNTYLKYYSI